jgi:hypothetical protein
LVTIDDMHDALNVGAHVRDAETGEDRYAQEQIGGQLLRIYSYNKGALVDHVGFVMDLLMHRLKPTRCREHEDCRESVELAEACWASTETGGTPLRECPVSNTPCDCSGPCAAEKRSEAK